VRRFQRELAVQIELQRHSQEILFDIAAGLFYHVQGLDIAAEQQVLAVVEMGVLITHSARAAAELHGAFEYGDWDTAIGQRDCGGHAGVAAADDSYCQPLPASPCQGRRRSLP